MTSEPRLFTLEELNALLPEIENLLSRFHEKKAACEREQDYLFLEDLLSGGQAQEADEGSDARPLERAAAGLEEELAAIRKMGFFVRSLERGWIDFPGERAGQKVYYCWKRGETAVRYYHFPTSSPLERYPV